MLPELIGNEAIKSQLKSSISHAYMVAGKDGSGRGLVLAKLAQKALCENPAEDACGVCNSCRKFEEKIHPDFNVYGAVKALSVEAVRDLKKDAQRTPNDSKRSVYVLCHADEMNPASQNALLKLLEEPPSHALFILVVGESAGVLETIKSRCQLLVMRPVPYMESLTWLNQRYPSISNSSILEETAGRCEGWLGKALDEMEPDHQNKEDNIEETDSFHQIIKGSGIKKSRKKEKQVKEKKLSLEEEEMTKIAEEIGKNMTELRELALFESCISLEKMDKEQLLFVMEKLLAYLSKALLQTKKKEILESIALVQEIDEAVRGNVAGGQLVGWVTAGTMTKAKGENQ